MSAPLISPALPADAAGLARLEAECFPRPRSEAAILSEINQPERYLLLTYKMQGRLEGYVGLEYVLDEGYVTDLAVFPRYRRRRVGTALMQELERRGQGLGLRFLTLEVRAGNLAALGLYQSLGYQEVGRRAGFYSEPKEDAILMTRWLVHTASQEFHKKYYDSMYDKLVRLTLKDGSNRVGLFNDEFYEDSSILVGCEVIQIADIEKMELVDKGRSIQ